MAYGGNETPQMALDRALRDGTVQKGSGSTYFCNVCNKSLASKDTIKSHLRTQKHLKETARDSGPSYDLPTDSRRRETAEQKTPGESLYCEICDKHLKTKYTMKAHLLTKTHMNKLQNSTQYDFHGETRKVETAKLQNKPPRDRGNASTSTRSQQETARDSGPSYDLPTDSRRRETAEQKTPGESFYCEICDKHLKTKYTMKAHLITKTHMNKLQNSTQYDFNGETRKVETAEANEENDKPQAVLDCAIRERVVEERDGSSYFCNICRKSLKSKATIKSHLTSQTHLKNLIHYDSDTRPETVKVHNKMPRGPAQRSTSTSPQVHQKPDSRKCYDGVDPVQKAFAKGILSKLEESKGDGVSFRCNICKQDLKVSGKLKAHLSSKKHNSKISGFQDVYYEEEEGESEDEDEEEEEEEGETETETEEEETETEEEETETEEEETEEKETETEEEEEYYEDNDLVSKSLRDGTLTDNSSKNPTIPYWCNICMQPLMQYGRLAFHLESKKHKSKVTKIVPQGENLKVGFEPSLIKVEVKTESLVDEQQWKAGAVMIKKEAEPNKYLPVEKEGTDSLKFLALSPPLKTEFIQTKPPTHSDSGNEESLVYFDLETGGLHTGVDILQIAAKCDNREFNEYVTPTRLIPTKVTQISGLRNPSGPLELKVSDNPKRWRRLSTRPITDVLQGFLEWLDSIGPCYLVAHNASFDKRHLLHHVNKSGMMPLLVKNVRGFIDTLTFFRKLYPQFKKQFSGKGHSLVALMDQILHQTFNAHDALADIRALEMLVDSTDCSTLLQYMKPI